MNVIKKRRKQGVFQRIRMAASAPESEVDLGRMGPSLWRGRIEPLLKKGQL